MATTTVPAASNVPSESRTNEAFPELTPEQLARIEPHGHRRWLAQGEVVGEPGQPVTKIFVVLSEQLDAVTPLQTSTSSMPRFTPGMFTGERSILTGGRFLGRISATVPSDVIEVERDELLKLIQTDTELSDIFLRAFILRRLQLIDRGYGDVVVLGSEHCSGTLHIREFLTRNGHPYTQRDLDTDAESQELLDRFHLTTDDVPVVICRGKTVLKNPTIQQHAIRLGCDRKPFHVLLDGGDGDALLARAVIIATGVEYRKLAMDNLHRFENAGVYYAATQMERRMCADEEVAVVGGANSAGQAAVFLAENAKRVHVLIRSDALSSTMSRYLISRIDAHPRIEQHTRTEIVGLEGNGHLERVSWRTGPGGPVETQNIRHVFTMTGAEPSTAWLAGCLALDGKGFVKTGAALTVDELVAAKWPLRRQPYLLETSIPGVLAVGDVRSGSTKRVASAVGEGSIAIATVHQVLAE